MISALNYSIIGRAMSADKVNIKIHDLRDYTPYKHGKVDDYIYGGGAGMLLMIEPIVNCIESIQAKTNCKYVIYMAPDGELLTQNVCNNFSIKESLIILCGHYKGIDERIRENFITDEISIGDYVLSGGELPAAVFIDSIVRLIPGVISDETSALSDSFQDGLVAPPSYTRPAEFRELKVPEVLLSGNFKSIEEWRYEKSLAKTKLCRPHLLDN
jgi:tRNA (guanine37-N1)-methyltransferase